MIDNDSILDLSERTLEMDEAAFLALLFCGLRKIHAVQASAGYQESLRRNVPVGVPREAFRSAECGQTARLLLDAMSVLADFGLERAEKQLKLLASTAAAKQADHRVVNVTAAQLAQGLWNSWRDRHEATPAVSMMFFGAATEGAGTRYDLTEFAETTV
jgi:hypothetical protein